MTQRRRVDRTSMSRQKRTKSRRDMGNLAFLQVRSRVALTRHEPHGHIVTAALQSELESTFLSLCKLQYRVSLLTVFAAASFFVFLKRKPLAVLHPDAESGNPVADAKPMLCTNARNPLPTAMTRVLTPDERPSCLQAKPAKLACLPSTPPSPVPWLLCTPSRVTSS